MRDQEGCPTAQGLFDCLLNQQFGRRVETRGRLVEDQEWRIGENRASDGHPLTLSAGELDAAFADQRIVAVGQPADELVRVRLLGGELDGFGRRVRTPVRDVVGQGAVKQDRILRHDGERSTQRCLLDLANVLTVDEDASAVDVRTIAE